MWLVLSNVLLKLDDFSVLSVTGSHLHCESGIVLENIQDSTIVAIDH